MKLVLSVFVITVLLAGTVYTACAADAIDLSTLNKKPVMDVVELPPLSPTMPTTAPTALGGSVKGDVLSLSTLGKKAQTNVNATMIKGASPITVTPMFATKNPDAGNQAGTVFTLPQAVSASTIVYTPPFAIFGGA